MSEQTSNDPLTVDIDFVCPVCDEASVTNCEELFARNKSISDQKIICPKCGFEYGWVSTMLLVNAALQDAEKNLQTRISVLEIQKEFVEKMSYLYRERLATVRDSRRYEPFKGEENFKPTRFKTDEGYRPMNSEERKEANKILVSQGLKVTGPV